MKIGSFQNICGTVRALFIMKVMKRTMTKFCNVEMYVVI
jgi:hypothetical protein